MAINGRAGRAGQRAFPAQRQGARCRLRIEISRIEDPGFAHLFSDNISLEGIASSDYNQRLVETKFGSLLGGIRFYRRNIERPFVEIIAHSFSSLDQLADVVRREWNEFNPIHLRLTIDRGSMAPGMVLDQTNHVARYRDIAPGQAVSGFRAGTTSMPRSQ